MSQGEHVGHAVVPVEQDEGVLAVDAGAESAGALADVLGEVDPALLISPVYHVDVIVSEDGKTFSDVSVRFFYSDLGIVFRIHRDLEVGEGHFVQLVDLSEKGGVSPHMGSQALCYDVYLAVVHLARDLLIGQKAVEHVLVAAQLRHGLVVGHAGVIGGSRGVLVLLECAVESPESGPADVCVRLQLVVVLKERIAQRILFSVHCEGIEGYVRELEGVVDGIGDFKRPVEGGEDLLGLWREHVLLLFDEILEVHLAALGHVNGFLELFIGSQQYLAVDEGEVGEHAVGLVADLLVELADLVVCVVNFLGKTGVGHDPDDVGKDLLLVIQACNDVLGRIEPALEGLDQLLYSCLGIVQSRPHGIVVGIYQGKVPGLLDRDVFSF